MKTKKLIAAVSLVSMTFAITACSDTTDPESDLDAPGTSLVDPGLTDPGVTDPSLPDDGLGDDTLPEGEDNG